MSIMHSLAATPGGAKATLTDQTISRVGNGFVGGGITLQQDGDVAINGTDTPGVGADEWLTPKGAGAEALYAVTASLLSGIGPTVGHIGGPFPFTEDHLWEWVVGPNVTANAEMRLEILLGDTVVASADYTIYVQSTGP